MVAPYKTDKLGNVIERATGQHLGYIHADFYGGWMAVFSMSPITGIHDFDGDIENAPWYRSESETGQRPYIEGDFRTRVAAAEFLWVTRAYARNAFPPDEIQGRDIKGLVNVATGAYEPRFVKVTMPDGESRWAVFGRSADLTPGALTTIHKRSGEISEVELGDVLETQTVCGVPLVTVLVKPSPREPGIRAHSRRTSECPRCGEDYSGMWNGSNCGECGYRR